MLFYIFCFFCCGCHFAEEGGVEGLFVCWGGGGGGKGGKKEVLGGGGGDGALRC